MISNRRSTSKEAMVSSGKEKASEIGAKILKEGGNAIDAAVAVGFAMGVCEPATSGLGGGGFMTIKTADMTEPVFLDFREFAPEAASTCMWQLGQDGKVINKENAIGAKSVSVPGEVAGMVYALENYGSLSLEEVIMPSVDLAEKGIEVTEMMKKMLETYSKYLKDCRSASQVYLRGDRPYQVGEMFINPSLGKSLRLIASKGPDVFYKGQIGDAIVKTVKEKGGILTKKDLLDYKVDIKKPVIGHYRGYDIISSPPPSSGGTHIIQTLNILENFEVKDLQVNSPEYIHLFAEAFKLAYEDRAKFMGDTDFVDVPLNGLRSKAYAKILAEKIDLNKATNTAYYDPWTYEHDDTTHYSIADKEGNVVSVTKTINHFFGSCMVAEGTGILLNDTMADFSTKKYDINSVDTRKKPLSTMAPTIILKDGKPVAVLGSPGGNRIINAVVQVISKIIDHDMDVQEAIDSPRITQNFSNSLCYEDRIPEETVQALSEMGHEMLVRDAFDKRMGGVNGVCYKDGQIIGGADSRRDGVAIGL
ncbi:gamma-glutamyltransferase [Acidaminobacter sp. JC074]|uniref:gamma-glutamyltransferase n=1 Tax=Acidaminobacter sp. JC074 TaxID=2530199 RepID=UPI001F0E8CDF|nr:gamma-glutamyltransferase [Acidaminobacter sp. JC074]MCH4887489.1 gamma-glutamyltransferase [Acidaminobacter sp. JC074]